MDHWTAPDVLSNWTDGRIKAFVTHRALGYRGQHSRLFLEGEYIPVDAVGPLSESVVAYARLHSDEVCLSVVPRFVTRIHPTPRAPLGRRAWRDTALRLPERWPTRWTNILTGEQTNSAELAEILSAFPVALLAAR
jgi:(1->4)-alpha-D-glucan 1-alpha-D-glucosylmutase